MGVLNRTPDSFSDGGRFVDEAAARARIEAMLADGAEVVDIGAESTRPGAPPISDAEQISRLGGSVREAARLGAIVSVDTTSAAVAARALDDGAAVVNSVSLDAAAELGALCARRGAALVLMHCRGSMSAMTGFSAYPDDAYGDVVADVAREWTEAAERAIAAGLPRSELILDPGLGFTKNARHSLALCARLHELCALGYPVLVGPSRKSFLARAAAQDGPAPAHVGGTRERGVPAHVGGTRERGVPTHVGGTRERGVPTHVEGTRERGVPTHVEDRLGGTIAAVLACAARGAAMARVHDVAPVLQALRVAAAIDGLSGAGHRPPAETARGAGGAGARGGGPPGSGARAHG